MKEGRVYADPFRDGRLISEDCLIAFVKRALGPSAKLMAEHIEPVDSRKRTLRMLHNLKHMRRRLADHARVIDNALREVRAAVGRNLQ